MKRFCVPFLLIASLMWVMPAAAGETTWSFEFLGGAAFTFPTPLIIRQDGENTININARYKTKDFQDSIYYAGRAARWSGNRAWELEVIHLKIFLDNKPAEVQNFSISHGYNLLTLNRAWRHPWRHGAFLYRIGLGAVITHPESTVRGKKDPEDGGFFDTGFFVSGPTAQIAGGWRYSLWKGLFFTLEGKLTASYARIGIEDGNADVPVVAFHGLFGIGIEF